jgi:hypothetical protein
MSSGSDPPTGVLGWSLADLTVAGGVMLAVSMLVFPALRDSRDGTRSTVCQNNQYQLWVLVSKYATDHGDYFPRVRPNETAGVYAARLVQEGYVEPEELAMYVVCPSSPAAERIRRGVFKIPVLSREQIRGLRPAELKVYTCLASPSYGYALPPRIGDGYLYLKSGPTGHSGRDPLFGDVSGNPLDAMQAHHRGSVIHTITADGNLRSFKSNSPPVFEGDADIYHNDLRIVSAGLRPHDIVLGTSDAMAGLEFAFHEGSQNK